MDSLSSLLNNKNFDGPPEIDTLKRFIKDNYEAESIISISGKVIIISVSSSALAASLRLRMPEIKKRLNIDRKISFRIH